MRAVRACPFRRVLTRTGQSRLLTRVAQDRPHDDLAHPGIGNVEDAQAGGAFRVGDGQYHDQGGGDAGHGKAVDEVGLAHPGGQAGVEADPQGQHRDGQGRKRQQPSQESAQAGGATHEGAADLAQAPFR